MANKTYAIRHVTAVRKIFESHDGSHLTVDAYEITKGEFIRQTTIPEEMADNFNKQSHNSGVRYYEVDDAEIALEAAEAPKTKKRK